MPHPYPPDIQGWLLPPLPGYAHSRITLCHKTHVHDTMGCNVLRNRVMTEVDIDPGLLQFHLCQRRPNVCVHPCPVPLLFKKEPWCFDFQYSIWLSRRTDKWLCGNVPYILCNEIKLSYKHIKIWGMIVYIINRHVTINNLSDRSHWCYFMVYVAHTRDIIYWKINHPFVIHRDHHVWSDEYNSRLSIEDNHTSVDLLLRQDPEIHINKSDLLNFIPCELDLTYTTFCGTNILSNENWVTSLCK